MTYSFIPRYDGNASILEWTHVDAPRAYRYKYDAVKQLSDSYYMYASNSQWISERGYGEHDITYDGNGNITALERTDSGGNPLHSITNTYSGNQLSEANINGSAYNYIYDGNGNMTYDGYKGINISYNTLDLPERIFAGQEEVSYIYSASGAKLATKAGSSTTYYRGSFVYNNGDLDHILQPEGVIRKTSGAYVYYYTKKDHLGSTRVLCHEANGKMLADQTTDYYPFGLSFRNSATNVNRYLFSGKELQDQPVNGKSLQLYDFGARNYDPVLGRWFNIDPALQFTNPYTYCANNPIMYIDPNGKWIDAIWEKDRQRYQLMKGEIDRSDLNIYLTDNNGNRAEDINGNFVVIGQQLTENSFFGKDGDLVKGARLDNKSREGLDFLSMIHDKDPNLIEYMINAQSKHPLDFKNEGVKNRGNITIDQHYYRGYIIGKRNGLDIYASARDIGNYAAGYVSARKGLAKPLMRTGFDIYQYSLNATLEGPESTRAQNWGYSYGEKQMSVGNRIVRALSTFVFEAPPMKY